jgi:hypothetical protein
VREAVPAVRAVRSGSDEGDQRQSKGAGRTCVKQYPRFEPCDQDQTEGIRPRGVEWLRAALLFSAAVRSPELRQTRARVAPGSLEFGREEEGATVNSLAGKGP